MECGGGISETKGHNIPFEGTIAGPEGSFPFVSSSDANKVKGVLKVYLGINFGITRSIKEVCEKWKGYLSFFMILFNLQKSTQSQRAPFFLGAKRMGAPWGELEGEINPLVRFSSRNL